MNLNSFGDTLINTLHNDIYLTLQTEYNILSTLLKMVKVNNFYVSEHVHLLRHFVASFLTLFLLVSN